jgi:ribonuclease P protein subunit RPR2
MIARERMQRLLQLAEEAGSLGKMERGRKYVQLARRIGMRTNTQMPREFMYCRECLSPLLPGRNCRVRLRSNRVTITCHECGYIRRYPYIAEKRRGDESR